jgi:hypothetical protein
MPIPMTPEERELRLRLDEAVGRIRSNLARCPFIDELGFLEPDDVAEAAALTVEANRNLLDAMSCTESLEQLRDVSDEAVQIVATSRTALAVVREVLTSLSAALDSRRAA